MNPNNYFDKTADEFIAILEGRDSGFNQPQRANPKYSQQIYNQALVASGLDPDCTIYVPQSDFRQEGWRNYDSFNGSDKSKWRNPKQPFIYRIKSHTYWNRGANFSTGEGVKPELSCGINLLGCEFLSGFTIANIKARSNFVLNNCTFLSFDENVQSGDLNVFNTQLQELHIGNAGFIAENEQLPQSPINKIEIVDLIAGKLVLSGLRLNELIIRGEKGSIKELQILSCEIGCISISETLFKKVFISSTTATDCFSFGSAADKFSLIGRQNNEDHTINSLSINLTEQATRGEYYLWRAEIKKLEIKGRNNSNIHINECEIDTLEFKYLTNTGELSLHNIDKVSRLLLEHSIMGKAIFSNLEWTKRAHVQVVGSLLIDMVLMNTIFPMDLRGRTDDDWREIHSTLLQLKYLSSQTGNRIQELAYEAREMFAYQKDKQTPKSWGDRIVLWANWITNNHGQSWLQPLVLLILFTAFTFFEIKINLGYTIVWGTYNSNDLSDYLEFAINPLHEFDKVFEYAKTIPKQQIGNAKIWDFISKLFGGIILFQLIRAFRKYARSDAG
ncbi:hypothetical protein GCM10028818_54980 [Spirosoma horti]